MFNFDLKLFFMLLKVNILEVAYDACSTVLRTQKSHIQQTGFSTHYYFFFLLF